MRVAIDSGPLKSGDSIRGIGTYTGELLKALKINGVDVSEVNLSKYDVVHFTSFKPFFVSVPFSKPKNTKFVLTIYDLIPLIYPKHYPPGVKGKINWLINKWLIKKNIDAIITISETSKKDICRFLDVDPKKVYVIYLAPKKEYKPNKNGGLLERIKTKYGLPESFVFYLGDINYNKNIPILIKACKILKMTLVVGGKQAKEVEKMDLSHPENSHLKGIYEDLIDKRRVIRLGFISDEDANIIYNLALVYVQPSFYEGFGLSVIHAFASGCPVVVAKTQALVEIGEAACLFAGPNDPTDFANKIKQVIEDSILRQQLINTGLVADKRFSWEKAAEETMKVYKNI